MRWKYGVILLISTSILISLVSIASAEEWAGADAKAEEAIGEISPQYEPWFSPLFEPPSGEIESLLFSLQSAIGSLLIGYYIGHHRGTRHARNA
jgi:cobalt/nickel transport protein